MIRIAIENDSGQYIIFDDDKKLRVLIENAIIKEISGKEENEEGAKFLYIKHIDIAERNKEKEPNNYGYFSSKITIKDFCTRGVRDNIKDVYSRIPFNAVEIYEETKIKTLNDEEFKIYFNKAVEIYENRFKYDEDFKKYPLEFRVKELSKLL